MYSVTASAAGGVLNVLGDNGPNAITVSRDVTGNLLVNNGNVAITGSPATVVTISAVSSRSAAATNSANKPCSATTLTRIPLPSRMT